MWTGWKINVKLSEAVNFASRKKYFTNESYKYSLLNLIAQHFTSDDKTKQLRERRD